MTDEATARTGYSTPGDGGSRLEPFVDRYSLAETCTAISLCDRIFMGAEPADPFLGRQVDLLLRATPSWTIAEGPETRSTVDFYYWYHGTLATSLIGGEAWKAWSAGLAQTLIEHQRTDGDERGSWDPVDAWGEVGGRVYATAMNTLTLKSIARRLRVEDGGPR